MLFKNLRKPQCVFVSEKETRLADTFFTPKGFAPGGEDHFLIAEGTASLDELRQVAYDIEQVSEEMLAEFGHHPVFDVVFASDDPALAAYSGALNYVDDLPRGAKPSDDDTDKAPRWGDTIVHYAVGSRRDIAIVRGFLADFDCYADERYRLMACARARRMWRPSPSKAEFKAALDRRLWTSGAEVTERLRAAAVARVPSRVLQGEGAEVVKNLPLGLIPVLGPTNGGKSAFCERLAASLKLPYVYATEAQGEPHPASKVNAVWIRSIDRAIGVAASAAAITGAFAAVIDSGRQAVWTTPGGMGARGLPNQFSTRFTDASNALAELGLRAFLVLNPSHVDEAYLAEFTNTVMLMSSAWLYVRDFDKKRLFTLDVQAKPLRETRRLTVTFHERTVAVEPVGQAAHVGFGGSAHSPGPDVRSRGSADPYSTMLQRAFRNI